MSFVQFADDTLGVDPCIPSVAPLAPRARTRQFVRPYATYRGRHYDPGVAASAHGEPAWRSVRPDRYAGHARGNHCPNPERTRHHRPTPQAGVSLSTNQGGPGTSVTANGSGYRPGEIVQVTFNGSPVGAPTANTGGFGLSFNIANLRPGNYGVVATGESSGATAVTTFTLDQSGPLVCRSHLSKHHRVAR
jgi:hypothetical protein